jgi:hypothetical protein
VLRLFAWALGWIAAILCVVWAFGALYFDFPTASKLAAILFVTVLVAAVTLVREKLLKLPKGN